ncbi:MAG: 4Fe-4S binding protein [Candidatus Paceibacterales bacterium]
MRKKMAKISPIFRKVASFVFSKPATAGYPFTKPQVQDNFRGQMQLDMKQCIGCGLCGRDCPGGAIEMVDFYGKKRPQFRLDKCLFCYQCSDSCPKKAIRNSAVYELATTDKSSLVMKPKHVIVCQA